MLNIIATNNGYFLCFESRKEWLVYEEKDGWRVARRGRDEIASFATLQSALNYALHHHKIERSAFIKREIA